LGNVFAPLLLEAIHY